MARNNFFGFPTDKGGRRRIKDRRHGVSRPPGTERRTGLKRRSGKDRRFHEAAPGMQRNRRQGDLQDES